jgi:hypothetical protein
VWPPTSASLRTVFLDEVEQFAGKSKGQRRFAPMLSTFGPEWCSASLRNAVAWPESAAETPVHRFHLSSAFSEAEDKRSASFLRYGFAIRREILILGLLQPHSVQGLGLGIDDANLDLEWSEPRPG